MDIERGSDARPLDCVGKGVDSLETGPEVGDLMVGKVLMSKVLGLSLGEEDVSPFTHRSTANGSEIFR